MVSAIGAGSEWAAAASTISLPAESLPAPMLRVFLLQLVVLLVAALCLGMLARGLGLPALAGELCAGVLLGPTVLGQLAPGISGWLFPAGVQTQVLDAVSQFGVVLLVSVTAARLDTEFLRRRAADVVRIGLGAFVVPLGAGAALGFALPEAFIPAGMPRGAVALFLGVVMGVTAIPVIAKTLADLNLLHRDVGQLILASAALDDTAGWLLLAVVSAAVAGGASGLAPWALALATVAMLGAAWALGGPLGRLGNWLAERSGSATAAPTAYAVAITLLYAAGAASIGLEPVFGAFLAGVTVLRRLDPTSLAGLNTVALWVLAPIFVAGIGLRVDLTALAEPLVAACAGAAVLVAVVSKLAGAYVGARASRMSHWQGVALGAGMNSRGMVEVIIALVGLRLGLLTTATFTIVVLIAVVTSLLAPPMLRLAARRIPDGEGESARLERQRAWSADHPSAPPT